MANENNNFNELVSNDDDPTAELEILPHTSDLSRASLPEADVNTYDAIDELRSGAAHRESAAQLEIELRASKTAIDRLQFDNEQLHARLLGLESEVNARSDHTQQLIDDLAAQGILHERKRKLLKARDRKIRSLKSEIRQREVEHHALIKNVQEMPQPGNAIPAIEPDRDCTADQPQNYTTGALQWRLDRSDDYADTLRRRLQDLLESSSDAETERNYLQQALHDATERNTALQLSTDRLETLSGGLQARLDSLESQHQTEIRLLRFELGEAQSTMTESEDLNSVLTSDLIAARGRYDDIQHSLSDIEENTRREASTFQREVKTLKATLGKLEQKVSTKSEAITVLLAELAKRSSGTESADETDNMISGLDDSVDKGPSRAERVLRVLVGCIDGQTLRFPLFKDQLTIGRTEDNDIQLKAAHISRRHAVLQTDGNSTRIIDWGSKNGVFVNENKISEHFLTNGDRVAIGNARFRYEERKRD